MTVQAIYSQAVNDGNYDLGSWVNTKHDYVRNIWEDYLSQFILQTPLLSLYSTRNKIRVLDLGCGTGQGYKLIPFLQSGKFSYSYVGLDVNPDMIKKGKELFHNTPNVEFYEHDLCNGLGSWKKHFDVYFSSYGSLSYLDDSQLLQLLLEIASVAGHGSLIILDLLGRFSLEWPQYWIEPSDAVPPYLHDYSISYLSSEAIYKQPMKMRFWSTEEINNLLKSNPGLSNLKVVKAVDRSVLVGRHTDTREYNSDLPPIRSLVNQLFSHQLADLSSLIVKTDIIPSTAESADQKVSEFLHSYLNAWNTLVNFCNDRVCWGIGLRDLENWANMPRSLHFALMKINELLDVNRCYASDDYVANIVQPYLAMNLRNLEFEMQQGLGLGCGHGLVIVLQVNHEI